MEEGYSKPESRRASLSRGNGPRCIARFLWEKSRILMVSQYHTVDIWGQWIFGVKYSTAPPCLRFLQPEFAQVLMDEINPVITPEYLVVYDKCRHADYAGFLGLLPVVFQNFLFVRIV